MTLHLSGFAFVTHSAVVAGGKGAAVALDCERIAEAIAPAVPGQAANDSWVWIVPLGQRALPPQVVALAEAATQPVPVTVTWDGGDACAGLRFEAIRQPVEGLRSTGLGTDALVIVRVG